MRFIDLFAGLGGFHIALQSLGHTCVFASEIDAELRDLYEKNFGLRAEGDIRRISAPDVPSHELLCAGFPCQPFSKAGEQQGTQCRLWGDLFDAHVLRIIKAHKPTFILLENVANLERHNGGQTWAQMRQQLADCDYEVDTKVLSPHRFGIPQIRERLFIVGSRAGLKHFQWPTEQAAPVSIRSVLDNNPKDARPLPDHVIACLNLWQDFLDRAPHNEELPSFPIWTNEFGATYPYENITPYALGGRRLRQFTGSHGFPLRDVPPQERFAYLPSYAQTITQTFPHWKIQFIRQNREYYHRNRSWIDPWLPQILPLPASHQKFEWNCKGEKRDIWQYVIQFRASGVRIKRPSTAPSLVAMSTTQIPIIGWERRYMTPRECLRLQSMGSLQHLPQIASRVYQSLGNAVNAEIVRRIAQSLCSTIHAISHNKITARRRGQEKGLIQQQLPSAAS